LALPEAILSATYAHRRTDARGVIPSGVRRGRSRSGSASGRTRQPPDARGHHPL